MIHWATVDLILGLAALTVFTILFVRARARKSLPAQGSLAQSPPTARVEFSRWYAASSAAVFKAGCRIRLIGLSLPGGIADIELSTEYLDGWGPVQRELVARADGSAEALDASLPYLTEQLSQAMAVLSFCANAWVGDLTVSENRVTAEAGTNDLREIDEELAGVLLERVGGHVESATLRYVLQCYRRALSCWSPEGQAFALAHLHSGLLSMVEVVIRHMAQNRGLDRSALAKMSGISQEELPSRILETELYGDDLICLHASKLAWQAVAGGSADTDSYVVEDAHFSAARYLRTAVLRVLELEPSCHSRMIAAPYEAPLGLDDAVRVHQFGRRDLLSSPVAVPQLRPESSV